MRRASHAAHDLGMLFPISFAEPRDVLTDFEASVLRVAAAAGGLVYDTNYRDSARAERAFVSMFSAGLVDYTDAAAGGWDKGMWAVRLTYRGWNSLFAAERTEKGERHVGRIDLRGRALAADCTGVWLDDGTCDACGAVRPLDAEAYARYLTTLDVDARVAQDHGPRLVCPEHGRMRRAHITTQKVCHLPGTTKHDGGLNRI